jgi:glycosyltransferase involved in cell wall biosynthesis
MPLRIGVNALYLIPGGVGGTEIYLRGLLSAMARVAGEDEFVVFTNRESKGAGLVPKAPNWLEVPQPVQAVSRPWRIGWEQTGLPLAIARHKIDVLLNPGFTAPLLCGCPQVTVFHDMQHKRHPEYFRWFDLPFWRALLYAAAHVSRSIIAVSEATRADVLRYYRLPERKVRTVLEGVDEEFFALAERRSPEKFILAVSTLHPHKNLDGLLRAWSEVRSRYADYRLIVCGMHGFFAGPLHELRESLGLRDSVEFPGWIPRADLLDLYRRAAAFIYPTRFEGFGIPVLEALAAGVPCACSAIEPLISIAGGAALHFDPADTSAIREAMVRLLDDRDLQASLVSKGQMQARQFSWKKTAVETLAVLGDTVRQ